MKILPDHVKKFHATKTFTEEDMPSGLLKNHKTKENIWGLIRIEKGEIEYTIENVEKIILTADINGVIEPEVSHHIKPLGSVSFVVEFYK